MFIKKDKYYIVEELESEGIGSCYTTLELGNMMSARTDEEFASKILKRIGAEGKRLIFASQTHSTNIQELDNLLDLSSPYMDTDGFITPREDVVIMTLYADCLPIFAFDKKNRIIALAHAGWKGSFDGMQRVVVEKFLKSYNSDINDLIFALGIGIKWEDYPVGEEFYENYKRLYPREIIDKVFHFNNGVLYYDNYLFNKLILLSLGVREENIIISDESTFSEEFHSYRRDRERSGRNAAFIWFK